MQVTIVAATATDSEEMHRLTGWRTDAQWSGERLIEFAGRACYQSWDKPNPTTATNAGYIKHILEQGHESVLEHASATVYVTGVSRSLTHELIRHRHLSVSELSQRFVSMEESLFVKPPALTDEEWTTALRQAKVRDAVHEAYYLLKETLQRRGLKRKPAREAARAVLPNATETKIVITGNYRAWRHVLWLRGSSAADAEIREFALAMLELLKSIAPHVFADLLAHEDDDGVRTIQRLGQPLR